MFRELTQETTNVFRRGTQLQKRIEDIHDKVTQLNPNVDVCEFHWLPVFCVLKIEVIKVKIWYILSVLKFLDKIFVSVKYMIINYYMAFQIMSSSHSKY